MCFRLPSRLSIEGLRALDHSAEKKSEPTCAGKHKSCVITACRSSCPNTGAFTSRLKSAFHLIIRETVLRLYRWGTWIGWVAGGLRRGNHAACRLSRRCSSRQGVPWWRMKCRQTSGSPTQFCGRKEGPMLAQICCATRGKYQRKKPVHFDIAYM